jgi:hypothetical protein
MNRPRIVRWIYWALEIIRAFLAFTRISFGGIGEAMIDGRRRCGRDFIGLGRLGNT